MSLNLNLSRLKKSTFKKQALHFFYCFFCFLKIKSACFFRPELELEKLSPRFSFLEIKKEVWIPEQLLGFFISFFPFFSSAKDIYQDQSPVLEKKQKKTRLSNKEKNFEKISYEEIGLFPRSFSRVFDRFVKQLFNDVENLVLQEYRFYRYLFLTTVKCVFILFLVPFIVNLVAKNYLVRPLTEYLWNTKQSQIFLNAYQQKHAFSELKYFEEKLYFESLVFQKTGTSPNSQNKVGMGSQSSCEASGLFVPLLPAINSSETGMGKKINHLLSSSTFFSAEDGKEKDNSLLCNPTQFQEESERNTSASEEEGHTFIKKDSSASKIKEKKNVALQYKTVELAITYNNQSIEAITNFFADLMSVITFFFLLVAMEIPINISKSFLLEVFFGLDDSKKSLLILLVTDLLVGYHSDGPWAIFFESLFNHYGLPESQTGIFLLVATLPVLLDVLFKYLIFRHLNRASPATVATYHAMIE